MCLHARSRGQLRVLWAGPPEAHDTSKAKELVLSITQDAALFDVDTSPDGARIQQERIERTGFHTLPAIFIKGTLIGGFLDVDALQRTGDLEKKF